MENKQRLKIAIQKSGRLNKDSQSLLEKCGLKIRWQENKLITIAENMDVDILRVRDDDIPGLVFDGLVDLGIVGDNVLTESKLLRKNLNQICDYELLRKLDFGFCRLSIAIPTEEHYSGIDYLNNKRIATSYPFLLKQFMNENNLQYTNCSLTGSVEIATRAGLADAICDLVSSGATLEANGLKEVKIIYKSQACLIKNNMVFSDLKSKLLDKLLIRIHGVIQARGSKYIMMHVPKRKLDLAMDLLPGIEDPTILPLAHNQELVALHVVSKENLFWETMENLKSIGASSILVLPIDKMMK